jgi:hypothetical protein
MMIYHQNTLMSIKNHCFVTNQFYIYQYFTSKTDDIRSVI